MIHVFIYIWFFLSIFWPYILGIIISTIIIFLIRKKIMEKDKTFKNSIYVIIIIFCLLLSGNLSSYLSEKPDRAYSDMIKINNSERLIGLSNNEVINLLGKPLNNVDDNTYIYDAGTLTNYFFLGGRDFYEFFVWFDEKGIVKSTSIELKRGG